jgi:hypothetical protein
MWGQTLDLHRGRVGVRATFTSPLIPQEAAGLPPRDASFLPSSMPLLPALDGDGTRATAAPFLLA